MAGGVRRSRAPRARSSAPARARRPPRPARPASWAISANVRSSARKSGKRSVASASSTTPRRDVGEVVALGDHLGADQHARRRPPRSARRTRRAACRCARRRRRRRRGGTPGSRRRRRRRASSCCEPLGAGAVARDGARASSRGSAPGTGSRWPQWWQASVAAGAVQHERDVAVRAAPDAPARAAGEEVRPAAAVEQHDRLAAAAARTLGERLRGARVQRACGSPRMSSTSTAGSGRPSTRRGSARRGRRCDALRPRRGAAERAARRRQRRARSAATSRAS